MRKATLPSASGLQGYANATIGPPLRGPDLHFCQLENDGLPSPSPQAFFSMFQKNCTGESTMPVRLLRKAMGCWTRPQGT